MTGNAIMTRQEIFNQAANRLAETKKTEDAKAQCRYDFEIAADFGYQYAQDESRRMAGLSYIDGFDDGTEHMLNDVCDWLVKNADNYVDNFDGEWGVADKSLCDALRKTLRGDKK